MGSVEFEYSWVGSIEPITDEKGQCYQRMVEFTDLEGNTNSYYITYHPEDGIGSESIADSVMSAQVDKLIRLAKGLHLGEDKGPHVLILSGENFTTVEGKYFSSDGREYTVNLLENLATRLATINTRIRTYEDSEMDEDLAAALKEKEDIERQLHLINSILDVARSAGIIPGGQDHLSGMIEVSLKPSSSQLDLSVASVLDNFSHQINSNVNQLLEDDKITLDNRDSVYEQTKKFVENMKQKLTQKEKINPQEFTLFRNFVSNKIPEESLPFFDVELTHLMKNEHISCFISPYSSISPPPKALLALNEKIVEFENVNISIFQTIRDRIALNDPITIQDIASLRFYLPKTEQTENFFNWMFESKEMQPHLGSQPIYKTIKLFPDHALKLYEILEKGKVKTKVAEALKAITTKVESGAITTNEQIKEHLAETIKSVKGKKDIKELKKIQHTLINLKGD